jgi:DNA-binding MarR family transcriptional regulator/N-acetylglutamate synthase-like GNAT family acetyltransferase
MEPVHRVRSFNRTVTEQIGALDDHFLGRDRSLGASRLLFEIGTEGIELRRLRARLGLDSGYTSRLLRGLEGEGLIRTVAAPGDARVRRAELTAAGREELTLLNQRSDQAARTLLGRLSEGQQARLVEAMATVEGLLVASAVHLEEEDAASAAGTRCLERYFGELSLRFEHGFDPARGLPAEAWEMTPPHGHFLVAWLRGEPVGCGGLKCHEDWGEIKRMWVAPEARGLGLAKRILARLEDLARARSLATVRLETNRALTEARSLYQSSGFQEVAPYNDEAYAHHWFEKVL